MKRTVLIEARFKKHWSQQEAAEAIGIDYNTLYRWEAGKSTPHGYNLRLLCEAYNMTAAELGFEPQEPASRERKPATADPEALYEHLQYGVQHQLDASSSAKIPQGLVAAVQELENQPEKRCSPYLAVFSLSTDQFALVSSLIGSENEATMNDPTRREAILKLLGMAGAVAVLPLNAEWWERLSQATRKPSALNTETFDHFERLIGECWILCDSNELEIAESILSSFLPKILALSPQEGKTAYLASHGLRLQSVLAHHRLKLPEKMMMCQQSAVYARSAHDANTLVTALVELADAYEFNQQMDRCLQTLQEAVHYTTQASPLVQSRAYSNYAIILAALGRGREADFYIRLARDVFPDKPTLDPGYPLADSNVFTLSYHIGLVSLSMEESTTQEAFELYKQHPSESAIPERLRLEIINGQSRAAIRGRDLERYADLLERGIQGALTLGSQKRFEETRTIFQQDMPQAWLANSQIKTISEHYQLERKSEL